jgi:hypothetical protein
MILCRGDGPSVGENRIDGKIRFIKICLTFLEWNL